MNDRSLPPLALDPVALARTAKNFLDAVEVWGYVLPCAAYDRDQIARGHEPSPLYVPDRRNREPANVHNLLCAFRHLEAQFNPDQVRYSDPRRIARIADWLTAEEKRQLLWHRKRGSDEPRGTRWRSVRALALALDTIWDWWDYEGGARNPDDFPGSFHPWQLPRGLVRDMRAAADDLTWSGEDDTRPPLPRTRREPLTPLGSHDLVKLVVLTCSAISRTVWLGGRAVAGTSLLSLLDDLCQAADCIPAVGWEDCVGDAPFEFAGIVQPSAHQAALPLAEKFRCLCWDAAYEAKFRRWGATSADFFLSSNLLWDDFALHKLQQHFVQPPFGRTEPVPVQRWLTQLDIEAARLRAATAHRAPSAPADPPKTGAGPVPAVVQVAEPPAASVTKVMAAKARGKHVGARMLKLLEDDRSCYDWSAEQFAQNLGCSKPTVINTKAWKNIMTVRALRLAERVGTTSALAPRRKKG